MNTHTFITTYSNQRAKFDTVAYPIELKNHLNLVEQKTNYKREVEFSTQDAPSKFIVFQQGSYKFYAKVIFLGSQGTNDRRGGNYLATTIAIDKNNSVNPAQLFLEDSLWKSELTEEEDFRFKRDSNLPAEEISLPNNKYSFVKEHINELRNHSPNLLRLISVFLKRGDKNILVNSQRMNYSKLFFLMCDILPNAFTAELSLSLHPNNIDREVADFVETIEYSDKKLMSYSKMFNFIDFFNHTLPEALQLEEQYLLFLNEVLSGDEAALPKIEIFNALYKSLLFNDHNLSSLDATLELMRGNIEVLFQRQNRNPSIPVSYVCSLLLKNKSLDVTQCLAAYLENSTILPNIRIRSYIDFASALASKNDFSLISAIKVYEEKYDLKATDIRHLIVSTHLDKQFFDAEVSEYLLLSLSKFGKSKDYEDMLRLLNSTRPEIFETPRLGNLWEDFEIRKKILTADNPKAILFTFTELLTKTETFGTTSDEMVFQVLKKGLEKPWKVEHLELSLTALYKKMFQKASIAAFIHQFLEYVEHHEDGDTPSAEFILRNIINQITEKDPRLLFLLCRELDDSRFHGVMKSEIENRFTVQEANSFLHPVG